MTPLNETLNKAVRDIINSIVGIDGFAIRAEQTVEDNRDAPRPTTPHASVKVLTSTNVGWEENILVDRTVDPDIDFIKEGYREIAFSTNYYYSGAYDYAQAVQIGLMRESIKSLLRQGKLGLATRSPVRDLTEALEYGYEERANFDFVLATVARDEEIIRSILSWNISGIFETGTGNKVPINIEVN